MVIIMSKKIFTDVQVKKLNKNKWIKKVTNKGITYTNEFKYKLVKECENYKKFPQEVFRECGIDPEIVGKGRIEASAHICRKQLNYIGKITDTRTTTILATYVPIFSALCGFDFSSPFTKKVPSTDASSPKPQIISGYIAPSA